MNKNNISDVKMIKLFNIVLSMLFILGLEISNVQGQSVKEPNLIVSKEAQLWKLEGERESVITYFPCSMVDCKRFRIEMEGFYKAYFEDGFVLTILPSGEIFDHYYHPSPNNLQAFIKNLFTVWSFEGLPTERKKRVMTRFNDMQKFFSNDMKNFFGSQYLHTGNFQETIKHTNKIMADFKDIPEVVSTALAIKSIAQRELGQRQEFFDNAEKSYSLNPNNVWSLRAMAILYIDKGNFNQALELLQKTTKDEFDKLLKVIAYGKLGDMKNAVEIFGEISDDYFETRSIFLEKYITLAKDLIKPYKELKLKTAKDYESKKLYKEAIKEYQDFMRCADEKEAKELRSHVAVLMMNYPHLFMLPEEARKIVIRAEVLVSEGNFEIAIEEYKKAIKIQPFFPALYKALALNYAQIKNYKQAIRNMQIYLELYPDAPDSRSAMDEIYRWEFMMQRGK